uniref:Uncharacterized protein n=1 Tax=Arundo donax TaxID=35708 RepID=A0A0A9T4B2_ARUDO
MWYVCYARSTYACCIEINKHPAQCTAPFVCAICTSVEVYQVQAR